MSGLGKGVVASSISKLLQLSGIGKAEELKELGIHVIHNLPGVGKNLQDHLETYIQQECKTPDTLYSFTKLFKNILKCHSHHRKITF